MPTISINTVIQHLRKISLQDEAGLSDGQLLGDFIAERDEAAFAALVRRHGSMVMGVCRRVVNSHQDAEDAFQATFLVLVRKAASIASRELLANWLYGVAYNTALKARASNIKRQAKEKQVPEMPDPAVVGRELGSDDLQALLDQELSRLPEKYRVPVVLCDLEGKTRKEAAQQVGCPEGSLSSRLSRARTLLAKRLTRRGLAVSGTSLAAVLSQQAASASVPAALASNTIQAATLVAAGQMAAAGVISPSVAALTEGVLKTMLLTKLKTALALALVLSMMTLTTALLAWGQTQDKGQHVKNAEEQTAIPLRPDREPTDPPKYFTNSIGMKFVWIPPGSFMMGSPWDEEGRVDNETQHKVTLTKGFYMGVDVVTQEQWLGLMGENHSQCKGEKNLPVEHVEWDDGQKFLKLLRDKDKKPYRLPTEAEWEYSCRAGTTTPFHFGRTISADQANYRGEFTYGLGKQGVFGEKTTPVDSLPANAWGLRDVHGNVSQWCQDWYDGGYPQKDVVDPQGPEKGQYRVLRGGAWFHSPQNCRSAFRNWSSTHGIFEGYRFHGVRVCFFLDQKQEKGAGVEKRGAEAEVGQTLLPVEQAAQAKQKVPAEN